MPMPINTYTLPNAADVPDDVRAAYLNGTFDPKVRDWHLARLPRFIIPNGTYILCPWCGKAKDNRSMQIDHVIPIRIYVRFRLYKKRDKVAGDDPDSRNAAYRLMNKAYNDVANLGLCCQKCNSGSKATLPTNAGLDAAAARVHPSDLAARLRALKDVVAEIKDLAKTPIDLPDTIIHGPRWNTGSSTLRSMKTKKPDTGKMAEIKKQFKNIQAVVSAYLVGQRPQFTVSAATLQGRQLTTVFNNQEGRLCFYCLGLFKRQSFHLDHVNPTAGHAASAQNFNNPTNLIPVCRTCNTARAERPLTAAFLDAQIVRRQGEHLPGIENVVALAVPNKLAYGRAQRVRVIGL